jgi:hypothetical protein
VDGGLELLACGILVGKAVVETCYNLELDENEGADLATL